MQARDRGRAVTDASTMERRTEANVPTGLRSWVRSLVLRRSFERNGGGGRELGSVLTIEFREPVLGIKGLPVTPGKESKAARVFYTHVSIERLPSGLMFEVHPKKRLPGDHPLYRLSFWRPTTGQRMLDASRCEEVWRTAGDLTVLKWIVENGLRELYETEMGAYLPPNTDQRMTQAGGLRFPREQEAEAS